MITDEALVDAARAFFETLDGYAGWRLKIIGAFASGAFGYPYEPPAPHVATGFDVQLNNVTARAHAAGVEFAKKDEN